ncbi:DUF4836 family protein [Terrimonas sp. NA20]|uniref:DUF4836 family protein n=1 Tax=Terrimonas ginsenosidimutans TaxID=2908004 RepID=A0ABS9KVH9_9BACT|nr:DUF4836 family protein [Terrimonas ginsenosidimutans]MCG2616362.1 DUF4836 family protein [Terrimonas ginsenosidimutans]
MMKRNPLLLALAAAIILFAASCKKGGKTGLLVPKEAAVVIYFNAGSLSSKLSWAEIKQSEWFKELQKETSDSLARKLMNDPAVSGLDTDKGFCFFMAPRGRGAYVSFQGSIKDQAAFEAMVRSSGEAGAPKKSGDLNVLESEGAILTWNASTFVIIADAPVSGANNPGAQRFSNDSLTLFAKNTYALKGKALLDEDSRFADLIKSKGDMHMWLSVSNLYSSAGMGMEMMTNMLKLSTLTEGNIGTATLSFDEGKINFDGKQYYGKELTKLLSKYSSKGIGDELTGRLPAGDVLVAGAYSYPMGVIMDIVKLVGADGLANMFLGQKGITLDDIGKAFKGEMAFAVTDVEQRIDTVKYEGYDGKTQSYATTKTDPTYVFGAAIDDQKSFDKLYNIFGEEIKKVPSTAGTVKTEKGWLLISNSNDVTASFYAGNNKPAYADKIQGHQFGVFFNLQKLFSVISTDVRDSTGVKILEESRKTWQDVVMSADYKGGEGEFHFEVNLLDKGTNSLKQMNQYAEKLNAIRLQERSRWNEVTVDSASTEAPPKAFN